MAKVSFRQKVLEAREQAIVAAVNRLLATKGFDAMTVDDIVAIVPENTKNNADDDQHNNALTSSSLPAPFIIPLTEPFSGILRQQDLRPKSSLEIRIDECYHPGDVILARIHANGAERDFILTTAESELGVIQAICERSGMPMNPISWKEMQCPVSLVKEGRKVAKPRRR